MCASPLYCTFWYPTIFHHKLKPLLPYSRQLETFICDGSDNTYKISIQLDKEGNLFVTSTYKEGPKGKDEKEKEFTLELHRTKYHRNGFVQYSFDKNVIPTGHLEKFKNILVKDIYHLAKEFYHQHEVDINKDAALRAVITEKEGGIDEDDNQFLISFLKDFAPVFERYAKHISYANNELIKREKRISIIEEKKKDSKSKYRNNVFKIAQVINQLCENACIEYTYCKTLLSSIHNKSFIHNLQIKKNDKLLEEKKEWRRCALNIRNSMRYIENMKYKNLNRINKVAQYLLEDLNGLLENVNTVTDEVKINTESTKSVIENVSDNTENIKLALKQGKRSARISLNLAIISLYTSLALSLPFNKLPFYNNILWGKLNLTIGSFINILIGLGFLGFLVVLLCQKYNKKNK